METIPKTYYTENILFPWVLVVLQFLSGIQLASHHFSAEFRLFDEEVFNLDHPA
jgi:hypothetical protein